jgi:hypothetical protein
LLCGRSNRPATVSHKSNGADQTKAHLGHCIHQRTDFVACARHVVMVQIPKRNGFALFEGGCKGAATDDRILK